MMISQSQASKTIHVIRQTSHGVDDIGSFWLIIISDIEFIRPWFPALDISPRSLSNKTVMAAIRIATARTQIHSSKDKMICKMMCIPSIPDGFIFCSPVVIAKMLGAATIFIATFFRFYS